MDRDDIYDFNERIEDAMDNRETLKAKLLEVIEDNQYIDGEFLKYATDEAKEEAVAAIKQAFIDAGWRQLPEGAELDALVEWHNGNLLTEEEWEARSGRRTN